MEALGSLHYFKLQKPKSLIGDLFFFFFDILDIPKINRKSDILI